MGQFGDSIFDSNTDCNTLHDLETAVPPGEGNELLINQKSLLVCAEKSYSILCEIVFHETVYHSFMTIQHGVNFCLSFVRNGIKNICLH